MWRLVGPPVDELQYSAHTPGGRLRWLCGMPRRARGACEHCAASDGEPASPEIERPEHWRKRGDARR